MFLNAHNSRWKKANVKRCSAVKLEWCRRNREKVRALKRAYYEQSDDVRKKQAERAKRWFLSNKQKSSDNSNAWRRRNLAKAAARQRRRWATKLNCTPPWADHAKIQEFYDLARRLTDETGIPHEVDHIYPLMGKDVTGLHIPINLQVLPQSENRSKGNRVHWEHSKKGTMDHGLCI